VDCKTSVYNNPTKEPDRQPPVVGNGWREQLVKQKKVIVAFVK
jgi:hypothetical protein